MDVRALTFVGAHCEGFSRRVRERPRSMDGLFSMAASVVDTVWSSTSPRRGASSDLPQNDLTLPVHDTVSASVGARVNRTYTTRDPAHDSVAHEENQAVISRLAPAHYDVSEFGFWYDSLESENSDEDAVVDASHDAYPDHQEAYDSAGEDSLEERGGHVAYFSSRSRSSRRAHADTRLMRIDIQHASSAGESSTAFEQYVVLDHRPSPSDQPRRRRSRRTVPNEDTRAPTPQAVFQPPHHVGSRAHVGPQSKPNGSQSGETPPQSHGSASTDTSEVMRDLESALGTLRGRLQPRELSSHQHWRSGRHCVRAASGAALAGEYERSESSSSFGLSYLDSSVNVGMDSVHGARLSSSLMSVSSDASRARDEVLAESRAERDVSAAAEYAEDVMGDQEMVDVNPYTTSELFFSMNADVFAHDHNVEQDQVMDGLLPPDYDVDIGGAPADVVAVGELTHRYAAENADIEAELIGDDSDDDSMISDQEFFGPLAPSVMAALSEPHDPSDGHEVHSCVDLLLRILGGGVGATEKRINAIPLRQLRVNSSGNLSDPNLLYEQDACSICLDGFEMDNTVRELQCGHVFHPGCVDEWLKKSSSCPICNERCC